MATYKGLAQERHRLVDRLDKKLARMVVGSQKSLLEALMTELSSSLVQRSGTIANSATNITRTNRIINTVTRNWVADKGMEIARFVAGNIFDIENLNRQYYTTFLNSQKVAGVGSGVLGRVLAKYGVNPDGSLDPDGYLFEAMTDTSVSRRIKSMVSGSVQSETKIGKMKTDLRGIMGRGGTGIVEGKIADALPNGLLQVDRDTNTSFAVDLELNYAIYQGGTIQTTRDFCDVRNGKVFSRDEILDFGTSSDEFGGYTNKSAGEFTGKNKGYNPLVDLGGYNCRHGYDWISDKLAFTLRPELKTKN